MDDATKWLILNADKVPGFGWFVLCTGAGVVALYREWIVLGGPYRKCMAKVEAFEQQATTEAQLMSVKAERLEEAFQVFKQESQRQLDRLEAENERLRDQLPRPRR